jgi:hypothetical protein
MTLVLAYSPVGSYTAHPTLVEAVNDLRQDLFDRLQNVPSGAAQRWADDDLVRALDRAVDQYGWYAPLVQAVMTSTLPQSRYYARPAGAWWIETVEYPTGVWPQQFVNFEDDIVTPSLMPVGATSSALASGAGALTGSYQWATTFVKSGGETTPGAYSASLSLTAQNGQLTIPLGPPGTIGRNIYRQKGVALQGFVGQVLDNQSTSFTDSVPDGSVGALPPTADTTANLVQFMLKLSPSLVPQDTTGVITVTYAGKHQLSSAGTSIPERHHDIVILGAAAYAMFAYMIPTADLFEYQDGELRDRLDERSVPTAWLNVATAIRAEFKMRLEQVKQERLAGVSAVAQWGDEPLRWQRT